MSRALKVNLINKLFHSSRECDIRVTKWIFFRCFRKYLLYKKLSPIWFTSSMIQYSRLGKSKFLLNEVFNKKASIRYIVNKTLT